MRGYFAFRKAEDAGGLTPYNVIEHERQFMCSGAHMCLSICDNAAKHEIDLKDGLVFK